MPLISMMQGRLSKPTDSRIQFFPPDWESEFELASRAQIDGIEWLYDLQGAGINPIRSDEGIEHIRALSDRHGVGIPSICAHCFIEEPLVGSDSRELDNKLNTLSWLLRRAKRLGARHVVTPLEDGSRLEGDAEISRQVAFLKKALLTAEETGVEIDLETSLTPARLALFLERIQHPLLKVNYDCGNSAGLGYRVENELEAYGHRIGSVHIKDKLLGGPTVALGKGAVDFPALSAGLRRISYLGGFVLEVARGRPGDELNWARRNRTFILEHVWPARPPDPSADISA